MDFSRDYYEIIGLDSTASTEDIKKAYKKLAKKYHPDINKSSTSEELFKLISEAYEVLSDESLRAKYDLYRKLDMERDGVKESQRARQAEHDRSQRKSTNSPEITGYGDRTPARPERDCTPLTRSRMLALSAAVPGFYQVYSGQKNFGYMLFSIYFIFWALAFFVSFPICILAIIILLYSFYEAYAHSSGSNTEAHL